MTMTRRLSAICFAAMMLAVSGLQGQPLQLARVTLNDTALHTVPRYSWLFPIEKSFSLWRLPSVLSVSLTAGLVVRNQGVIYDRGADRLKHRIISAGPRISLPIVIADKVMIGVGYAFNYTLHYKEKRFPDRLRKNKQVEQSEWFSERVPPFQHSLYAEIGMARGVRVFGEYFLGNLYNTQYQDDNGQTPYAGLQVQMFNVGINFSFSQSAFAKKKTGVYYEED